METTNSIDSKPDTVCLIGKGKLAETIANNLRQANQPWMELDPDAEWPDSISFQVVLVITEEQLQTKQDIIQRLEKYTKEDTVIAVNTESIPLEDLQQGCTNPKRVIGLNWAYPADLSFFLEVIVNQSTDPVCHEKILALAKKYWNKDPYTVYTGISIRGHLFAAMAREAFYLVENGYATIDSVDRSCRNDAGYYLAFAGNFRYMDLMGTGGYGVVMETLNRELAKQQTVSEDMQKLIAEGKNGMDAQAGFYQYSSGDPAYWEELQRTFGHEVRKLMERYPITFDYDLNR